MFDPNLISFSSLERTGEVTHGPAGAMADYSMTASYGSITKEMSFKVLHDVMNPLEPDMYMYETALDMAKMAFTKILQDEFNNRERDEMVKEASSAIVNGDNIQLEDIKFGEIEEKKDFVQLKGTFLGHTMAAHSPKAAFDTAARSGHLEKMLTDMKFSLLHSFRSAHYRLSRG